MVSDPECRVVHWERALQPTSRRLNVDLRQAEEYIVETVRMLSYRDFVRPVWQRGVWFDVYALYRDGLGWWVKLGEDEDGAMVVSHHEPEKGPETTVTGTVIAVHEPGERLPDMEDR